MITGADPPHRYETHSEMKFERAYPDSVATEEYRIEPEGTGSRVHYKMTLTTVPGTGALFTRVLSAILTPLVTPGAIKRNFRGTLRYAERHAGVTR